MCRRVRFPRSPRRCAGRPARLLLPAGFGLVAILLCPPAVAQKFLPPNPAVALGKVIPFDGFVDEDGRDFASVARAADGTPARPWIVSPIYTRCAYTCGPITASLRSALDHSELQAAEYRVVSFSFDPAETTEGLRGFRTRMQLPQGWLLLRAADREALARTLVALDFRTITIGDGAIEHPNLVAFLTPDRRLAQYLFGVAFSASEVVAAVRRAQAGVSPLARWEGSLFAAAAVGLLLSAFVFFSLLSRRRRSRH